MTLTTALHDLPNLIAELRTRLEPGTGEETGRRPPGFAKHAPTNLGPLDAADDLFGALVEHAGAIADTIGTKPPRTRVWGGHRGIPAGMDASTAHHQARALSRFIEHQLPLVRDADLAQAIESDILERWRKNTGRYPRDPEPEHVDARCGHCGRLTIRQHPPENAGDDQTWRCHTCGLWMTERDLVERRAARHRELKAKKKRKKAAA